MAADDFFRPLGEDPLRAPPVDTPQPAHMDAEQYRPTLPRQIGNSSSISAMYP
jgi:hypothetical protein